MREFTSEMLGKLHKANDSLKGSANYNKFYMETSAKSEKGRWFFVGHHIPHGTGHFKKANGKLFIINEFMNGEAVYRYEVTDAVRELLDI